MTHGVARSRPPSSEGGLFISAPPPEPGTLFRAFAAIGLRGFGGVAAVAMSEIVDRRAWLSPATYRDVLGICQIIPGANVGNVSVLLGSTAAGATGAAAALGGLLAGPFLIALLLSALFGRVQSAPVVQHALHGLGVGAAGLAIATAIRLFPPPRRRRSLAALAALAAVAAGPARFPIVPVLLILLPAAVIAGHRTAVPS